MQNKNWNLGRNLLDAVGIVFIIFSAYTLLVSVPHYYEMLNSLPYTELRLRGDMGVSVVILLALAVGYFAMGFLTIVFRDDLENAKAMMIFAIIFTAFVIFMRLPNIEQRTIIWAEGELHRRPTLLPLLACSVYIIATNLNHKLYKRLEH